MRKLALLALAVPLAAHAGCKDLAAAIDAAHKEIASLEAFSYSTPDPQLRQKQANQLAAINANLLLMAGAKCPMPLDPITADGSAYSGAAGLCATPRRSETACLRETWKRNP